MCNFCQNSGCNSCYPSVPNQWNIGCPTMYTPIPVSSCQIPAPLFPFDGLYTQFARILTSQLDFLGMPITKKTLIPAPGVGKMIVPINIFNILSVNSPAAPYQDVGLFTPSLIISLGTHNIITDATILGGVTNQTSFYDIPSNVSLGTLDNQPLTLTTSSQPVVGNSSIYSYILYITVNI